MNKLLATFITLILVTIYNVALSQNRDSLGVKKFILTTSVLEYIPGQLNTGNFNIGSEFYLKKRKAVYINLGIIKSYGPVEPQWLNLFNIPSINTIGFRFQAEGKYYLNKHKIFQPAILLFWPHILQFKSQELQNTGYYVAFHSSYQFTNTERKETVIDFIDDTQTHPIYHYKQNIYSIDRNALQLHLKIGYQSIKKYGLVVDYAVGFGIEYIYSSANNKFGDNGTYEFFPKKLFDSGDGFFPSFVYQVRIGWAH